MPPDSPDSFSAEENTPLQYLIALSLFSCGFFAWIFKPRYGFFGDPIIPYSPLQVGLPLLGVGAFIYILLATRTVIFRLMRPSLSSALLLAGSGLVILGASVHVRPGPDGTEAFMFVFRWLLPFFALAFILFTRIAGVSTAPLLLGFLAGAAFSAVAVELKRLGLELPVSQTTVGRFGAFLNHPNQYGILISTTAPLVVYYVHQPRLRTKLLGLLALPILCLCLFQAQSKTNIVLFGFSLACAFFIVSLHDRRKFFISLAIVAAGGIGFLLLGAAGLEVMRDVAPNDAKIIEDILFDPGGASSIDDREGVWQQAIELIRTHPLFGLGPGQAENYLPVPHAHNLLLQLYLDAGLLGFIGICAVVFSMFIKMYESAREAIAFEAPPDRETMLRLLASVSVFIYVLANAMSDSFGTATMSTFVLCAAVAYGREPEPLAETSSVAALDEPWSAV